jgi:hypothetical protein
MVGRGRIAVRRVLLQLALAGMYMALATLVMCSSLVLAQVVAYWLIRVVPLLVSLGIASLCTLLGLVVWEVILRRVATVHQPFPRLIERALAEIGSLERARQGLPQLVGFLSGMLLWLFAFSLATDASIARFSILLLAFWFIGILVVGTRTQRLTSMRLLAWREGFGAYEHQLMNQAEIQETGTWEADNNLDDREDYRQMTQAERLAVIREMQEAGTWDREDDYNDEEN